MNSLKKSQLVLVLLTTILLTSMILPAAVFSWQDNGVAVTTAFDDQRNPDIAPDGSGGAIICWTDERAGISDKNIYAQRIDAQGKILWSSTDVAICITTGSQDNPRIIADGNGGAIIAWVDSRTDTGDIYAQKVDSAGNVQWTINGVAVCTASGTQDDLQLVSDGQGGAIIAWNDVRYSPYSYVFIQHIASSDGSIQWGANGKAVAGSTINAYIGYLLSDNAKGAYLIIRNNTASSMNLIFQHINSAGTALLSGNGTEILDLDVYLSQIKAVHSSDNQILITGTMGSTAFDLWATKIDGSGSRQWGVDGVTVCNAANYQEQPDILTTSNGGAFVVWIDDRDGTGKLDLYLEIIGPSGTVSVVNGVPLIDAPASKAVQPHLCTDGEGGAFLVWMDNRTSASPGQYDILYHHINSTGTPDPSLSAYGEILCDANFHQGLNDLTDCIVSNGQKGAIVVWYDYRNDGVHMDIYAGVIGNWSSGGGIPGFTLGIVFLILIVSVMVLDKRHRIKNWY